MKKRKYKQATPLGALPIVGPGFKGLNTELPTTLAVDPTWAAVLDNIVWEQTGEISQRKGARLVTVTPATGAPIFAQVYEYLQSNGNSILVAISNAAFWASTDDGATWSDITGSVATTNGEHWGLVTLNGTAYLTGPGEQVYSYNGSGNVTLIATSPVTNGVIAAGYGRVWVNVDGTSEIKYCALLTPTDWTGTDSGTIDATTAWTAGQDVIRGIVIWGATFVVFGSNQILLYVDGAGSQVGIDPDSMYVVDTIEGSGLYSRDAVCKVGEGDLWFLSLLGVQSIRRAIADKSNPIGSISANVRSLVTSYTASHTGSAYEIKAVHSSKDGMVLFFFPESDAAIMFDSRSPIDESGAYRCATWSGLTYEYGVAVKNDSTILFALSGGQVADYATYGDYQGGAALVSPTVSYGSLWLDGGAHTQLKILKEARLNVYGYGTLTGTMRWAVDYRPLEFSATYSSTYSSSGGEWSSGEFNTAEFGDGLRGRDVFVGLSNEGSVFKVYLTLTNSGTTKRMALRELVVFLKTGRAS